MPGASQPADELAYWLALHRAPGLGAIGFRRLTERLGPPQAVLKAGQDVLRAVGLSAATLQFLLAPDWAAVERDLAWAAQPGHGILTLIDAAYPPQLREIADAPPVLFVRGNPGLLHAAQVAIVGSRRPSDTGREIAYGFAKTLAGQGLTITSGMAYGIDAAAHLGALAVAGGTIAVLGNGLDRIYPARHGKLAARIAEAGALVSEFPLGTPPLAAHFPHRNRIISGLSLGVIVVEAGQRSGSLISARLAADQGREVFAVPGSIFNPLARGCHALIRDGAMLIESAIEVLEVLRFADAGASLQCHTDECGVAMNADGLDADQRRVLGALGYEPVSFDTLVERTGLTAESVSSMLLVLELRGYVSLATGGFYCRVGKRG
jgi:DNA processing protein